MNKKQQKIAILSLLILTVILLALGLIFIGAGHVTWDLGLISGEVNGFDLIKNYSIGDVLSSSAIKTGFELADASGQLTLIRCGIVFAVILAPILFAFTLIASGFYFFKKK